ncbi:O-antigen ligase family protein [Ruminiclostridium cellobioparum]|uniref:O-Antigen ligase n=1 Tax=Ruminiclostridium cellobioparum subsp. termitidis CT1112 TaxID=1195236 RepID=S0FMM6_RUMCE|nr:O-antigen ligase family protein [Ruminiclostridium cellobioparum]EMS70354.1 O-Antigen ligase [Ruminiclostridium cellobioparum subsp. termitidis CT1112]
MIEAGNKKIDYHQLIYLFLILVFFPFPSKSIGYSVALYVCDFTLIGYISILILKKRYPFVITNTSKYFAFILILNFMGILVSWINGYGSSLRQFTEIIRTIEWVIIHNYFYNLFEKNKQRNINFNDIITRCIVIILLLLIPFIVVELFNLPLKPVLRELYEMNKSGNIFQYYNRIVGPFRNPNFLGIWISITFIYIYLSNVRVLLKVMLLLECGGIVYFSGSRTALFTCGILFIIALGFQMFNNYGMAFIKQIAVIGILIVLAGIVVSNNSNLFFSIRLKSLGSALTTLGERTAIWESLGKLISDNFIFGNGIIKSDDYILDNLYLQYIFNYGIVGLSLLVCFLIRNLYRIFIVYVQNKKNNFLLFLLMTQIAFIIVGVTVQIFDVLQIVFWYFMSVAYTDYLWHNRNTVK